MAAEGLARVELRAQYSHLFAVQTYRFVLISGLLFISSNWLHSASTRMLTIVKQISLQQSFSNQITFKNLLFISKYVHGNDLVLSDLETSWLIPTFGGKIIATLHPQAFIPDLLTRQRDLETFFDAGTNKDERLDILRQYHPKFLLLDQKHPLSTFIANELANYIELIDENAQYKLFKVRPLD